MLEMMISGGGDPNTVKWSGPGPKKLIAGNKEAGYFGTVSPTVLFNSNELDPLVTSDLKTKNTITVWHKFILNNSRVFYFPNTYMTSRVGWGELYKSGLIYGVRGAGRTPLPAHITAVSQLVTMVKSEVVAKEIVNWPLLLRTLRGTDTDPYTDLSVLSDEMKLIKNIMDGTWASVAFVSGYGAMMERDGTALKSYRRTPANPTAIPPDDTIGSETLATSSVSSYVWYPVVELIRENIALDPLTMSTSVIGNSLSTPMVNAVSVGVLVHGPQNLAGTTGKSFKPPFLTVDGVNPIINGEGVGVKQNLMATYEAINLISAPNNLIGLPTNQARPPLMITYAKPTVEGADKGVDSKAVVDALSVNLVTQMHNVTGDATNQLYPNLIITTVVN